MAWSKAFQKCIFYYFLDNLFCKLDFAKNFYFCKFANFFADSKSKVQELSIICHIWTSNMRFKGGGGGQIDPPQLILVFKYPSRDRVKLSFV